MLITMPGAYRFPLPTFFRHQLIILWNHGESKGVACIGFNDGLLVNYLTLQFWPSKSKHFGKYLSLSPLIAGD
jgi:hypothetical protein